MEIERKFLIEKMPEDLERFPHAEIIQAYLNTEPVLRIRKYGDDYIFTYKGSGLMVREEYNLPLTKEAFEHLLPKADGKIIQKVRYRIPLEGYGDLVGELDIFTLPKPLTMIEVEFPDEKTARGFVAPAWFGEEVTDNPAYHNSRMI
jgi:CYTH domain-containing protein